MDLLDDPEVARRDLVRVNVGCGPFAAPGWINADLRPGSGVDLWGDLRDGLALDDQVADTLVAMHLLQDLSWLDIPGVLAEFHRVLKPGGTLRAGVPDLDRALRAYSEGDASYFLVPDRDARRIGAKLVTQIIWYGSVLTPFTYDYAEEVLLAAGFREVRRCAFRQTGAADPLIVALDNRERETLFVEAVA